MLSKRRVESINEDKGFREDIIEKVLRLEELTSDIFEHPYLSERLLLKGGTPLNFCYFNTVRLSVDIDLNYSGEVEVDEMKKEKPEITKAIKRVTNARGYDVISEPREEHAGGKWLIGYKDLWGHNKKLEIDINYLFRVPIGIPQKVKFKAFQDSKEFEVSLVSKEELFAGKTVAALFRTSAKDVYDLANIIQYSGNYDPVLFRKAVILLGASQRRDLREIKPDVVYNITENNIQNSLVPLIQGSASIKREEILRIVEPFIEDVLNFDSKEKEFLDRLLNNAEYKPNLLFKEYPELNMQLKKHPALLWKRLNVEKYLGKQ